MKKIFSLFMLATCITFAAHAQGSPNDNAEQRKHRASLGAEVKETTDKGVTITINYSQPALKGRTIGKDVEPMDGKVWRTGANEATFFEINKDVMIEGKKLPAGKYGLYSIKKGDEWTFIFNKTWKTWGAFSYKESDDVLRIKAKGETATQITERMTFTISHEGRVELKWGNQIAKFMVH